MGWFAVTGSERCGHGFNGGNAGVCGVSGILYSFKVRVTAALEALRHPESQFFRSLWSRALPECFDRSVGHFRIKAADRECSPHTVKGPTLTSKSTMLGWGTLRFNLLFD